MAFVPTLRVGAQDRDAARHFVRPEIMPIVPLLLLTFGAIGHVILWVALVNRAHGLGIHRRWVNVVTLFCVMMFAVMPWVVAAVLVGLVSPRSSVLNNSLY